jgi:hypothetical protein
MRAASVSHRLAMGTIAAVALASAACGGEKAPAQDSSTAAATAAMAPAEYTVVVKSAWTAALHPFEYPAAGALTGPHFSGLIGAAHNASYAIFSEGSMPTPGLERLSEEGKHEPLSDEIKAATSAGTAGPLFESGPLRDFNDSLVATVKVDEAHPMVSLVMMVAPSPDWFTGVSGVNLMENGAWVPTKTLDLLAYDSGGDDGTTYKAPDKDNNPKKPTTKAATPHFVINGVNVPVGSVTFTKK